ncbi:uncharacterized protein LOC135942400 isoform X2 [Cloeon dipterum]|uniref:uncharacterized protein LOC135942400 isoform X2 n=1 Tax=Cloeon dipterum TaxID=197152 RepID=UPI00322093A8
MLLPLLLLLAAPVRGVATAKNADKGAKQMREQVPLNSPSYSLIHMDLSTGTDIGGCFERVAIGRRLAEVSISVPLTMLTSCEKKCYENNDCRAFSFGMGRHGNGTCEMQVRNSAEKADQRRGRRPRKLETTQQPEDPDYDLFERKPECDTPSDSQHPPGEGVTMVPPFLGNVDNMGHGQGHEDNNRPGQGAQAGCFRRLFSGKKVAPHSIRRSMPVRSVQECEHACLGEKQFLCEGFNLRVDNHGFGRGSCELTDVTSNKLGDSLLKNFVDDYEFSFYERQGGSPQCGPASSSSHGGGNSYSGTATFVPSQGPPGGYNNGNGFPPNQRPPSYPFGQPPGKPQGPYGRPGQGNYGPGPGSNNFGPRPQGPGPNNYGPGPNSFGPGPNNNFGSGPNSYGPGPNNFGPGPNRPGPSNFGPGPNSYLPGNNFVENPYRNSGGGGNWQQFSSSSYGNNRPHEQGPISPGSNYNQGQGGWNNNQNTVGFYGPAGNNYGGNGGNFNRPLPPPPPPPGYGPNRPPPNGPPISGPWNSNDDECFARVWSGQRLDKLAIRGSSSHPSMGGCQLECLQAKDFVCRAYSYRHGPPGSPGDSCILSDRPMPELHPREGLVPDNDFETYERILSGRGCEHIAPFPSSTPWQVPVPTPGESPIKGGNDNDPLPPLLATQLPGVQDRPNSLSQTAQDCYAEYWPSARLSPNVVTVATHAPTLTECLSRCTNSQQKWKTPCRSLAYRHGVHDHNCLLSELAQRDLRPNSDFVHDEDKSIGDGWRLMAWDWSDERCRVPGYGGSTSLNTWDDRDKNNWNQRPAGGYGSTAPPSSFSTSFGGGSGYGGSSIPPPPPTYSTGSSYFGSNQLGGSGGDAMAFTVSGKPCAAGHVCTMNPGAEFWSCPLDSNHGKDWDYCCSPTHRCGYSEGMQMPWCYVGLSKLQWRPCSERYWPYQNSRMDDREGRFLPVAYLHKSGPPGSEELHTNRNQTTLNASHSDNVTYERINERWPQQNETLISSATNSTEQTSTTTAKTTEANKDQDDSMEMIPVNLTVVEAEI